MPKSEPISITAVWSRRIGDIVQTLIEHDGKWYLVCECHFDGPFSHIAEARGGLKRWVLDPLSNSRITR